MYTFSPANFLPATTSIYIPNQQSNCNGWLPMFGVLISRIKYSSMRQIKSSFLLHSVRFRLCPPCTCACIFLFHFFVVVCCRFDSLLHNKTLSHSVSVSSLFSRFCCRLNFNGPSWFILSFIAIVLNFGFASLMICLLYLLVREMQGRYLQYVCISCGQQSWSILFFKYSSSFLLRLILCSHHRSKKAHVWTQSGRLIVVWMKRTAFPYQRAPPSLYAIPFEWWRICSRVWFASTIVDHPHRFIDVLLLLYIVVQCTAMSLHCGYWQFSWLKKKKLWQRHFTIRHSATQDANK